MPNLTVLSELASSIDRRLRSMKRATPGAQALEDLFGTLFFSSLQTDEHQAVRVTVAFVDPENPDPRPAPWPRPNDRRIIPFGTAIPLTASTLRKLSRAADPFTTRIAVFQSSSGPFAWALIDQTHREVLMAHRESRFGAREVGEFTATVSGTGEIRVFARGMTLALLRGDRLIARFADVLRWGSPPSSKLARYSHYHVRAVRARLGKRSWHRAVRELPDWPNYLVGGWFSNLARLTLAVQRYRHGGALLICPGLAGETSELHAAYPMPYRRLPSALVASDTYSVLNRLHFVGQLPNQYHRPYGETKGTLQSDHDDRQDELEGAIRFIASLSRVDGTVLLDGDLAVAGFGVEIRTSSEPSRVFMTRDTAGRGRTPVATRDLGTRHRSMIRFCAAHPKAVGIVVSQDGDVRVVTRVDDEVIVWENVDLLVR